MVWVAESAWREVLGVVWAGQRIGNNRTGQISNHCGDAPTVRARWSTIGGVRKVVLHSTRAVVANEELLLDYGPHFKLAKAKSSVGAR